jgi:hypothetical protein
MEASRFQQQYAGRLAKLVVNSKPIIDSLTDIAREYPQQAPAVVDTIVSRILQVSLVGLQS